MEARAVLYGINKFIFENIFKCQDSLLDFFFIYIRSVNTGFLSCLRVNFLVIENIDDILDNIQLREDGLQSL